MYCVRMVGKGFQRALRVIGAAALLQCVLALGMSPERARADDRAADTVQLTDMVQLTPGLSADGIERSARYLVDDGQSIAALAEAFADGGGGRLALAIKGRGEPYQPIWAYVSLLNQGVASEDDDQPTEDQWILTSATYGMLAVEAYLVTEAGPPASIMSHAYDEAYDLSEHSASRLRSEAIEIPRGAAAALLVRLRFGPVQDVRLALEAPDDLTAREFGEGFQLAAFYAFTLATLVFFFGFHLSLSNAVGMAYAGLFAIGLTLIAYVDGLTFRFLYPESPSWHFPFGILATNILSGAGFLVGGLALRGAAPSVARHARWVFALAMAPVAVVIGLAVFPQELVAGLSYALVLAMFALQAWVIWQWRRESGEPQRIERAVALAATASIAVLIGMIATGLGAQWLSPPATLRALFGLVGLLSMLALTMALVDLPRRHAQAVEARIVALEQEADSANARLEAERRYARARDLAELRQRRLATASHDIRQPLSALRMRMSAAGGSLSEDERGGMMQALDYLERLSTDYLSEARPDGADTDDEALETTMLDAEMSAAVDPYPASLVLGAVRQMFTEDAVSKGLRLRVVDSSLQLALDPLAVIRIISNLTSNAIRHTQAGRVLVGARGRGAQLEIIVADTGPGFAEGGFEALSEAYAKGAASEGEGLGLAICIELAEQIGATLEQRAPPGKGACFVLSVPRAAA